MTTLAPEGDYTLTDHFCGAGGSSQGAIQVPGIKVAAAANHWKLAIETHNTNHPTTDHICADLSTISPAFFPRTKLAWFSPECTNHSQAKGIARATQEDAELFDPTQGPALPAEAAERSRATMWDVVRFTEHHRYLAIVVENVVEATKWVLHDAWLKAMDSLGYRVQIVSLNSMHAQAEGMPAPQSRDRVYWLFTRKGDRPVDVASFLSPQAWCPRCEQVVHSVQTFKKQGAVAGRYKQQYVYVCPMALCRGQIVEPGWLPAASIIDWSNPGQRIGDRSRPLADKTRARIAAGIARYWGPIHLEAAGSTYDAADPKHVRHGDPNAYYRAWSTDTPFKTIHTSMSKALAVPVEGRDGKVAKPVDEALRTQTARNETGVAFVTHLKGSSPSQIAGAHSPVTDPLHTVAAGGNHHGLVMPYYGTSKTAKPTEQALDTVTTTDRHALITPAGGTWSEDARPATEPSRTITTRESYGLVMRNNSGGAEMTTPVGEPVRTITTAGHQSLITPGDIAAAAAAVDDVMFRMFDPDECKRAMAFPASYVMLGTKRERVRLAGNAVTPPSSRDILAAVVRALEGR